MNEEPETNIDKKCDDRVIDVIKKNKMRMRPRWYFVVRAVLIVTAAVLLFMLLLYVVSFIIFALDQDGGWFAANLGPSGWSLFFTALPWGLFLLSIALLFLLANLLERYTFVYHQPFFYFLFVCILVTTLGGFFLAATSFNSGLLEYSKDNIPVLGNFYQREVAFPESVHRERIVAFVDDGFIVDDGSGVTSTVRAASGSVLIGDFNVGDIVLVFGARQSDGTIRAFGIKRIAVATSTVLPVPAE